MNRLGSAKRSSVPRAKSGENNNEIILDKRDKKFAK